MGGGGGENDQNDQNSLDITELYERLKQLKNNVHCKNAPLGWGGGGWFSFSPKTNSFKSTDVNLTRTEQMLHFDTFR